MKRRDFLTSLVGGAASAGLLAAAGLEGKTLAPQRKRSRGRAARPPNDKRSRVGISTWSFHNLFPKTRDQDATATGKNLVLMDFPEMIADRYKVHSLEFVAPHFASTEPTYLQELKGKLLKAQSHLVNIPVDIEEIWNAGRLSDPEPRVRETAINASMKWIDIAKQLGARSVRCDPGKMNPDDLTPTIHSYHKLAAYGTSRGTSLTIENPAALRSQHPQPLVHLLNPPGGDFIGALPDFGNFPDEQTRMRGLPLLFPYARTVCHAKGLDLDASGNETKFDFAKCVEISKQAGYKGVYSIEYEGPGDPYDGVQKVVDELLRYL